MLDAEKSPDAERHVRLGFKKSVYYLICLVRQFFRDLDILYLLISGNGTDQFIRDFPIVDCLNGNLLDRFIRNVYMIILKPETHVRSPYNLYQMMFLPV